MPAPDECWFDHERLEVYQEAIAFIAWLSTTLEETVRIGEVKDQLGRASTSIPSILPRAMASMRQRIGAGFLILPVALRSNTPLAWTYWWPKRS
jgi:hypothetical protein